MKNVKWVLSIVIAIFLTWIIFDNKDFLFGVRHSLQVDLMLEGLLFKTPEWPMVFYLVIFLVVGFLVGIFIMAAGKLQDRSTLRKKDQEISKLKKELTELKNRPAPKFSLSSEQEPAEGGDDAPLAGENKEEQAEAMQ